MPRGATLLCAALLLSGGCHDNTNVDHPSSQDARQLTNIDSELGLNREDYRHITAPKKGEPYNVTIDKGVPPIPKLDDILAAPRPPKIGDTQLVSIAVTDDVPLKDVLLELAKLADVDIELDANISGGISFIAKDRPFNEVIDRVCSLAGLRYTMKNNVLRVERDLPYIKSYSLDFLNLDRDSTSSVNLSTNVLSTSAGGGSGGGGLTTGSTSSVQSKAASDFWKSLDTGILQILSYVPPQRVADTTLQSEEGGNVLSAATGPAPTSAGGAAGSASSGATVAPAIPASSARTATTPASSGNSTNFTGQNGTLAGKAYTINRQAGVLTVNATSAQHEMIERLLEILRKNASAQVLIEAKIVEVTLNDQYQAGINWQYIGSKLGAAATFNPVGNAFNALPFGVSSTPTPNVVSFAANNTNDILSLMETFGAERTLSSPRLHAINNQQSTMTFAENKVYFTVQVTPATATTTGGIGVATTAPTISSTVQTVPIGIMMTLMPSIDVDNNEVTLAVRPTLSTYIDSVADPAVTIEAAEANVPNVQSLIPEVQVRELDSTLKLKSGQTMVIGGLMQQTSKNTDTGIPFVSSLPLIGNAFKGVNKDTTNTELVLLIKATIVNTGGDLNKTDSHIFHKFSDDPRPVAF